MHSLDAATLLRLPPHFCFLVQLTILFLCPSTLFVGLFIVSLLVAIVVVGAVVGAAVVTIVVTIVVTVLPIILLLLLLSQPVKLLHNPHPPSCPQHLPTILPPHALLLHNLLHLSHALRRHARRRLALA